MGEGKAQKKFATDYLERRSRWKNSLKSGARYEDDLTVPASALSPGDGEFQVSFLLLLVDKLASHWSLLLILAFHWSILVIHVSHWSILGGWEEG